MPTYQYRCVDCSDELEVVQRFTDDPLTECPSCEGSLRKVFSAVGVVFKGSGFYATDNRTKGSSAVAAPASSDSSSKPAASGESSAPASTPAPSTPSTPSAPAASTGGSN